MSDAPRAGDLSVGFDTTPQVLGNAGVARYTRELGATLAHEPGVTLHRLGTTRERTASPMRNAERAIRQLAAYPLALGREAAGQGVDLIHCPAPIVPVRSKLPLVLTLHDLLAWHDDHGRGRVALAREKVFTRRLAKQARRVLVPSEFLREEAITFLGLDPDRVAVVPHGVDARFGPTQINLVGRAQRFGIPPGPFVMWVGTTEPRKNLAVVVQAFALLRQRRPDLNLVLVGEWGLAPDEVERDIVALGSCVIRPGYVRDPELAQLYSQTDCFVFPSLYEGFGLPVLEAMACGAPVVTSDRGALREVAGDAAVLVEPADVSAVVDAVDAIVGSPARKSDLRQAGLERSHAFTWQASAEATVAQYREAL